MTPPVTSVGKIGIPAKGQPYQECSVGMLHCTRSVRRNASPYQKSFSGEIKSCGVNMIQWTKDWRRGLHQVLKCLMTIGTWVFDATSSTSYTWEASTVSDNHFPYQEVELYGDMIQCDECEEWSHMNCVGLSTLPKNSKNCSCSVSLYTVVCFNLSIKKLREQIYQDYWQGSAKYPRIFGSGVPNILQSAWWGFHFSCWGARFPRKNCMGVPDFLWYIVW